MGRTAGGNVATLQRDSGQIVLVTGANGRVGRALRAILPENRAGELPILWHGRRAGPGVDLVWDIGAEPPVALPEGLIILHLAGRTVGNAQELDENRRTAAALCQAATAAHVFLMSSAAVYAPGPAPLTEADEPAPSIPYGRAKLAAERAAAGLGVTILRLANLAGADALLGNVRPGCPVVLDPIAGQAGGPERSYIGPRVLTTVLLALVARVAAGQTLPPVLNLAQPGVIAMADLLEARGQPWSFGPPRVGAVARVVLATGLLQSLISLPEATPAGLVADLDSVPGWPR